MRDDGFPPQPAPLSREGDATARLLALAEREFRAGLDEGAAFRRLERSRRQRAVVLWVGSTVAIAAALALVAGRGLDSRKAERVELTAESGPLAPSRVGPSAQPPPAAPRDDPALPARSQEPRRSVELRSAPSQSAPVVPTEAANEAQCRELSAAGRSERAVECFRAVARGAGLESEVAIYEAARLSIEALREPGRALALLDEHEKRFSGGAMRGEVAWLRVRSLRDLGRLDEALARSEALLSSPEGRALASELHWLRGRIYQDGRADCARAVSEFVALVGEPGPRGDEAELRRARCLERLGRSADAVEAYERYLERGDARHGAEARARLTELGAERPLGR